jgi:hypothetical protein
MTRTIPPLSFDEILDIIMMEEDEPSYAVLSKWTEAYPEHSKALTDFFVTWSDQEEQAEDSRLETRAKEGLFASRAVSHALNLLHQEQIREQSLAIERTLSDAVKAAGMTPGEFAKKIHVDEIVIVKLDKKRIPFETLPQLFFERVHRVLCLSLDQVQAHLRGPPRLMSATGRMRSKTKAVRGTESFLEAIEKSSLNEREKSEWRNCFVIQDGNRKA